MFLLQSQTFKKALLSIVCFCDEIIPFELFVHKIEICFVGFLIPIFASKPECFRYLKKELSNFHEILESARARASGVFELL